MSRLLFSIVCFLMLVISSGCEHEKNNTVDDKVKLENNSWKLISYGFMEGRLKGLPENKLSTLYFDAETKVVKGVVLCNSFESTYTMEDRSLHIVSVAPTEIYCGEDKEEVASFIVTSLSSIDRYEIDENGIKIYSVESRVLLFAKE